MLPSTDPRSLEFVNRRHPQGGAAGNPGVERRQFSDSHDLLSPDARELAAAIESYKIRHRRRFITYEEMLEVFMGLGYRKEISVLENQRD